MYMYNLFLAASSRQHRKNTMLPRTCISKKENLY